MTLGSDISCSGEARCDQAGRPAHGRQAGQTV